MLAIWGILSRRTRARDCVQRPPKAGNSTDFLPKISDANLRHCEVIPKDLGIVCFAKLLDSSRSEQTCAVQPRPKVARVKR